MTDLGRSLEHGDDAAGADHRRPGFAFSADHDLAFALGWPYVIRLVEDEDDPGEVALKLPKESWSPATGREPRRIECCEP